MKKKKFRNKFATRLFYEIIATRKKFTKYFHETMSVFIYFVVRWMRVENDVSAESCIC